MDSIQEQEWLLIKQAYIAAFRQALKEAKASYERLGAPKARVMQMNPILGAVGVEVSLEGRER